MKYKKVETQNGRTMYFVDGNMTSKKEIPQSVLDMLESEVEVDVEVKLEKKPLDTRKCIVCDQAATHIKFFNEENVGVCDSHYRLSLGKIAQAVREKRKESKA